MNPCLFIDVIKTPKVVLLIYVKGNIISTTVTRVHLEAFFSYFNVKPEEIFAFFKYCLNILMDIKFDIL